MVAVWAISNILLAALIVTLVVLVVVLIVTGPDDFED